jgi:mannosyltransferase
VDVPPSVGTVPSPNGRATVTDVLSTRMRHAAPLVALTLLAAVLRFSTLDVQSFSSDESVTARLVSLDFGSMLSTIPNTESTPPLYYVTAWLWAQVLGSGEVGLRSLSALIGTATIPVVYAAGKTLLSRRVGLAAAAVVAVSPVLVGYAQEARSYALLVALTGLSFAFFVRAREEPKGSTLAGWCVVSALALTTHYFAAFMVAPEALLLLLTRRTKHVWLSTAALLGTGLALLPLALEQRANQFAANLAAGDPLSTRVVILAKQFLIGGNAPYDRIVAVSAGFILLLSVVFVVARGSGRVRLRAAIAAGVGACAILLPVALALVGPDYVITRNALAGFIPLAIAACAGIDIATSRIAWLGLTAACTLLFGVTIAVAIDPTYQRPDWRGFARAMEGPEQPRILVVAPNLDGWSARVPLRVYLSDAVPIGRELLRDAPQFLPLTGRGLELSAPRRVAVREIVIAGVQWEIPLSRTSIPPPFRLVGERASDRYHLVVYRSHRPVVLDARRLDAASRDAAILFQPAE